MPVMSAANLEDPVCEEKREAFRRDTLSQATRTDPKKLTAAPNTNGQAFTAV